MQNSNVARLAALAILGLLLAAMASAAPILYTGEFTHDDNVHGFLVKTDGPATLTVRTLSFGGGTSGADSVAAGGFPTILSLFGFDGMLWAQSSGAIDADGDANIDSFSLPMGGTYLIALTEYGNAANGPTLDDGFAAVGQGDFTGALYRAGEFGKFVYYDSQRTNLWAVEFNVDGANADVVNLPEPFSMATMAGGLALLAYARRRRARRTA